MSSDLISAGVGVALDLTRPLGENVLRSGWGHADASGTNTMGDESVIDLPAVPPGDYILEIELWPFFRDVREGQVLRVVFGDEVLSESLIDDRTTIGYEIPAQMIRAGEPVRLRLIHPAPARPSDLLPPSTDDRLLSVSIVAVRLTPFDAKASRSTGVPVEQNGPFATSRFESLGDNCEFGLLQRRLGDERIGLFRFAGVPLPALLSALRRGLDDIERITPDMIKLEETSEDAEYMVIGGTFEFRYHTNITVKDYPNTDQSKVQLTSILSRKIAFEKRKFLEDLEDAEKIFIFRRDGLRQSECILPLWLALNRYGPNTLLWVRTAEEPSQVGTVRKIRDGLYCGYIDKFSPAGRPAEASDDVWLDLCRAAPSIM